MRAAFEFRHELSADFCYQRAGTKRWTRWIDEQRRERLEPSSIQAREASRQAEVRAADGGSVTPILAGKSGPQSTRSSVATAPIVTLIRLATRDGMLRGAHPKCAPDLTITNLDFHYENRLER